LFQRFLILAPEAPFIRAKEIREAPDTIISVHCIFYFIHLTHYEKKRNYTFTPDAGEFIDTEFDLTKERVKTVNAFDSFVG